MNGGVRYNVYDISFNRHTTNYGGSEWVVDGEYGRQTYPGFLSKEKARDCYEKKMDWRASNDE